MMKKREGKYTKDTKDRKDRKGSPRAYSTLFKKKKCRFCMDKSLTINHLDHQLLRRFTTERGKITPSRITGTCARHQRKLTKAIKRARNIGLLPYLAE